MSGDGITRDRWSHHGWIPPGAIGIHLMVPLDDGVLGERRRLVPPAEALGDDAALGAWLRGWVKKIREAGR